MKKIFQTLCLVLIFAAVFATTESAQAAACVTGFHEGGVSKASWGAEGDEAFVQLAALSCQEIDSYRKGLRAASYVFNLTGLGLACTSVGVPVSVGMFSAGFVLYTADLVVESLPCEDGSAAKNEKLVREQVCRTLIAQGISCDPNKLERQIR